MRARDRSALEAVFTDGARLSRGVTGPDGTFAVRDTPMDQFVDGIVTAETMTNHILRVFQQGGGEKASSKKR